MLMLNRKKWLSKKNVPPPEISYIQKTSVAIETCWIADADQKENNLGKNLTTIHLHSGLKKTPCNTDKQGF